MVPFLENFVVQCMDFHMKQNIVVVNMENNIVVYVNEAGLFSKVVFFIVLYHLCSRFLRGASRFGWLILIVIIIVIVVLLLIRRRRQQQSIFIEFVSFYSFF